MNFVLSSIYWRLLMKASLFGSPNFCWWSCKLWWRPFWRSTMARIDFVRTMTMPIMLIYSMMRSTQASVNNHGYLNPVFKTPRPRNFDTKKDTSKTDLWKSSFFAANEARLSKKISIESFQRISIFFQFDLFLHLLQTIKIFFSCKKLISEFQVIFFKSCFGWCETCELNHI